MFQLRGLGDCASDPTDPICQAFYGTQSGASAGGSASIAGRLIKLPNNLVNMMAVAPGPTDPGATQTTNPGTIISTTTNTKPWYLTWWGLGLIGAAGYGLWRYSHPKKPTTSPIAGLFGTRRSRR